MSCVNVAVCGNDSCGDENTCMTCGSWFKISGFGFGKLDIASASGDCNICSNAMSFDVRFPQCSHRVCVQCFKDIMLFDETRQHLGKVPFGCPPCPNGCSNPVKGRQCYCEEYDAIQEAWECDHPGEHKVWNDEENKSIGKPTDDAYGKAICPFCREKYDRSLHGFRTGYTKQIWASAEIDAVCYVCGTPSATRCKQCKIATYCSRDCQKQHWKAGHKHDCKTLV